MGVAAAVLLLSCGEENKIQGDETSNDGNNGTPGIGNPPAEDNRGPFDNEIGKPLSAWAEGCLDIHAINSGKDSSSLYRGTTTDTSILLLILISENFRCTPCECRNNQTYKCSSNTIHS